MHFCHIKHGFSKYLYQIFHKKSNKAHQNTHFVILQSCFCAKLSKNVNMLKKYHILGKIIIPGRQDTLDLSKLYTNLPVDMPEGCIYFWDVSFSPFQRNNFLSQNIFLKSIKFRPFQTIFLYYKVLVKTQKHHSALKFV